MMEFSLEDDLPEEFKGGTLSLHPTNSKTPTEPKQILNNNEQQIDKGEIDNENNTSWKSGVITIPQRITETIFSKKEAAKSEEGAVQATIPQDENPNNFFTFRKGVVEAAVQECIEQFLDQEIDGEFLAAFLLTEINMWNSDKERLVLLSLNTLVVVKYDFIALKRLEYKKVPLECIDTIMVGELVYPSASLVPRFSGLANGFSNILQNCLFERWSNTRDPLSSLFQPRKRNLRGIRLLWNRGKPINFSTKWNPFTDNVPFLTFTFHPLYFHRDFESEKQKSVYDVECFADKVCEAIINSQRRVSNETCIIHHKDILLENYVGLGSVIHNQNALGFFKVRGKFSF